MRKDAAEGSCALLASHGPGRRTSLCGPRCTSSDPPAARSAWRGSSAAWSAGTSLDVVSGWDVPWPELDGRMGRIWVHEVDDRMVKLDDWVIGQGMEWDVRVWVCSGGGVVPLHETVIMQQEKQFGAA